MADEPQSQPWPKEFRAHVIRVIDAITDPDQVTDKAYVDALFALVSGALVYKGTWDASTNTPTLANTDTGKTGHFYACTVGGSVDFGAGSITFNAGDRVINNGTIWQKWDTNDLVTSVFSRVGDIIAQAGDYTAGEVTNVPAGSIAAVTVQAAIDELDTEKAALADLPSILESGGANEMDVTGLTGLTYSEQAEMLYISDSKGNDTTGDGSLYNPFKTLQKAITWGASIYDTFDIFLSSEFPGATVTVPANKNIRMFSYPNYEIASIAVTLTGNGTRLYLQNISLEIDMDSKTGFDISMESGKLIGLTNGTPDLLEFKGTRMTQAVWNTVKSMATGYGLIVDPTPANNRVVIFQDTDMNGKKVINMANGVAATDGATVGQLPVVPGTAFADQQDIYYVSGAKGDTIANGADGSQFNPLSTINEAISLGVTAALDHIAIFVDYYDLGYDATIPDNKNVSIFCMETFNSDAYINTIILGDSCWVQVANIYVQLIKEASGISDTSINVINTFVNKLSDFAETGYATNTNLYSNNAWFNTPAEAFNAKSYVGTIFDGSGVFMPMNGVLMDDLTASQIVETDGSKNLISAAKGSAYNKAYGSGSGTTCEGDDDRLVGRGTSFPGSPSDGDLFNRTDLDMVFRYDGTRTKWLSESSMTAIFSRGAGAAGADVYFLIGNVPTSSTNGFPIIEDMTIVSAGFRNSTSLTRDIQLQVNGVNQQTLSLVAASIIKKTDVDVDVDVDEYISPTLINGTGALANGIVVLTLKWRAA